MPLTNLLVAASLSFASPLATLDAYKFTLNEKPEEYPYEITSGHFVVHKGKKYLCGRAKLIDGRPGHRRYAIFLESDWQIFEPMMDNDGWEGFNRSFEEICGRLPEEDEE